MVLPDRIELPSPTENCRRTKQTLGVRTLQYHVLVSQNVLLSTKLVLDYVHNPRWRYSSKNGSADLREDPFVRRTGIEEH
jgi:hypothetical protein